MLDVKCFSALRFALRVWVWGHRSPSYLLHHHHPPLLQGIVSLFLASLTEGCKTPSSVLFSPKLALARQKDLSFAGTRVDFGFYVFYGFAPLFFLDMGCI